MTAVVSSNRCSSQWRALYYLKESSTMKSSARSASDAQWNEARRKLREWLAASKKSQSELARLAGVNRSVVYRFLEKDQPLSTATATKLYNVLKLSPGPAQPHQWIEWLNLSETKTSLGELTPPQEMPSSTGVYSNIERGYYWLKKAWGILREGKNLPAAVPLFTQAEQAFGPYSTLAALAGCEIIGQYDNLSDMARAEQEVFRVEQTYQHVMDVQTRREFLYHKGMVAYDSRDYPRALQAVDDLKALEKAFGFPTYHEHIAGLAQLAMAERLAPADPDRQRLLGMAEDNIRFMCRDAEKIGHKLHIGFMNFRLAQILREQGRYSDADRYRKMARPYFLGEGDSAVGHIAIEEANLALLNGETTRARARAESAQDGWLDGFYAGGLGRVAAVTALSLWMEGRAVEALEPAIVAASVAPHGACFKGDRFVDLPGQINRDVRRSADTRRYAALIAQMQERVHLQSGHFACLARVVPDRSGAALALLENLKANHA